MSVLDLLDVALEALVVVAPTLLAAVHEVGKIIGAANVVLDLPIQADLPLTHRLAFEAADLHHVRSRTVLRQKSR